MTAKSSDPAAIAVGWWRASQPYRHDGRPNPTADRAALARLRRADLKAAMVDPATLALFRALHLRSPDDLPRVAVTAAVLATVREDDPATHPARRLGIDPADPNGRPRLSPLRFQRLMLATDDDERLTLFRRAVHLAEGRINVRGLAEALLSWTEDRRRRWIFHYYAAGAAAPETAPHHDTATEIEDATP
jgi:CRISPR system Cascade subunit CasB